MGKSSNVSWSTISGEFDGSFSILSAELPDGYVIAIGLERNLDGVLICTYLDIKNANHKTSPLTPINSRYFQTLGFGDLLQGAREEYIHMSSEVNEIYASMEVDRLLAEWKSYGSTAIPDKYYAAIALKYESFVISGKSNPIGLLADFMNDDKATTSSRVVEARQRGLLTTPEGNVGGQLTAKGKKLLEIGKGEKHAQKK